MAGFEDALLTLQRLRSGGNQGEVTIESTEGLVSQLRWTRAVVIALVVAGSATYFAVQTT